MDLYPAIDLISGTCVRLYKGSFSEKTVYSNNPIDIAREFFDNGAKFLHIVDLDAASGKGNNFQLISNIASQIPLQIQVGGGIRSIEDCKKLFESGVKRVVIGSICIKNPQLTHEILTIFGIEAVTLALDITQIAGEYSVSISGWQENSKKTLDEVILKYKNTFKYLLCTDISVDGTLEGPNFSLYKYIKASYPELYIQASGGISSYDDLKSLKVLGSDGAIVGKALYEKKINLKESFLIC